MGRLTNRIAKLERQQSPESVDCDSMLVELLAKRDALVYPWRTPRSNERLSLQARGAIRQRHIDYIDGRIGFTARASGKDAWKDAYQQRAQLISSGLATAIRSGGEVVSLRLTPEGESDARALVGSRLSTLRNIDSLTILRRCISRQSEMSQWGPTARGPARYMCEHLIFGLDEPLSGNPTDWEHLTELVLPMITANLMQAASDSHGRIYYSLTYNDEGKALVELNDIPLPPISTRQADPKLDDLYLNIFGSERNALENLESNELVIPLPCSGSWMEWQTREVRLRDAIRFVVVRDPAKAKELAEQTLADQSATKQEQTYAAELLELVKNHKPNKAARCRSKK